MNRNKPKWEIKLENGTSYATQTLNFGQNTSFMSKSNGFYLNLNKINNLKIGQLVNQLKQYEIIPFHMFGNKIVLKQYIVNKIKKLQY